MSAVAGTERRKEKTGVEDTVAAPTLFTRIVKVVAADVATAFPRILILKVMIFSKDPVVIGVVEIEEPLTPSIDMMRGTRVSVAVAPAVSAMENNEAVFGIGFIK